MTSIKPDTETREPDWVALWEGCDLGNDTPHPYLTRKGVESFGLRRTKYKSQDCLVVPAQNEFGDLVGLQYIASTTFSDGTNKHFHVGSKKVRSYFSIGDDCSGAVLLICEGYATGASLHMASKHPVFVAWDCHNLERAAAIVRKLHPDASIIICADNDSKRRGGNIGLQMAREAAQVCRGCVVFPDEVKDFNDLHREYGLGAVKRYVDDAYKQAFQQKTRFTATELMRMPNIRTEWFVKNMLPPGIALVGGAPKDGKSTLAMQVGAAIAKGEPFMGRRTRKSDVLYISLDEKSSKLIARQMRPFAVEGLGFVVDTEWPRYEAGGLDRLVKYLAEHEKCSVVVIDTLAAFFGSGQVGHSYAKDSEAMEDLKEAIARVPRPLAVLLIHHTVKAKRERWEDTFQLTNGITGGVQCFWHIAEVQPNGPLEGPYEFNFKGRGMRRETLGLKRKFLHFPDLADEDDEPDESHAMEWELADDMDSSLVDANKTTAAIVRLLKAAEEPVTQKGLLEQMEEREGYKFTRVYLSKQLTPLVEKGVLLNMGTKFRPEYLHPENRRYLQREAHKAVSEREPGQVVQLPGGWKVKSGEDEQ